MSYATARKRGVNSEINKLYYEDRPIHEWYRFVLSFPPHLVRDYLTRFGISEGQRVLDPFCGTGTVLVECKKLGIESVGVEANPMAYLASTVKIDWTPDPDSLAEHARCVAETATERLQAEGIEDTPLSGAPHPIIRSLRTLPPENEKLLLTDSISPLPLHKTLVLLECLQEQRNEQFHQHELLALAKAAVYSFSNLHFGPEVGVGKPKTDAPVISAWLSNVQGMVSDLREVVTRRDVPTIVHHADARQLLEVLEPNSIDAIITSPPYPNEKDYTRTTRLESVLLGLIHNKDDLRGLKKGLLRSNTRNVYKGDDDDSWIAQHPEIGRIADEIEARRIALGKTSGFEKLYAKVTKLYFGGMARHLAELRSIMRPGGKLAYVVGEQASYLRVLIPTGRLLADIGQSLGYEVACIDLFRTRLATATKAQLREEVVVLTWPGKGSKLTVVSHPSANSEPKPKCERHPHEDSVRQLTLGAEGEWTWSNAMSEEEDAMSEEEEIAAKVVKRRQSRYAEIMRHIFERHHAEGVREISFAREELVSTAHELEFKVPKNLGDIPYTFRYRRDLPESIRKTAPEGMEWVIPSVGTSLYRFELKVAIDLTPRKGFIKTKVPDATPGIVAMYSKRNDGKGDDEQALLAKIRYNRLIDVFTGVTCYSLQNHLRTKVDGIGQIETDEIYVGVDKRGAHYVFPVQAKGKSDRLGRVQIEQDFALCAQRFPDAICRPIAAQFMNDGTIVLFAFDMQDGELTIVAEKHYSLVPSGDVTTGELHEYAAQNPLEGTVY